MRWHRMEGIVVSVGLAFVVAIGDHLSFLSMASVAIYIDGIRRRGRLKKRV